MPYRSYEEKVLAILEVLCNTNRPRSRTQIAKQIGYKNGVSIRPIILDMVNEGLLTEEREERPQGMHRFVHTATEKACDYWREYSHLT